MVKLFMKMRMRLKPLGKMDRICLIILGKGQQLWLKKGRERVLGSL